MTIQVAILGATGYTGIETLRLLARHPQVEVTHVTSERYQNRPLADAFGQVRGLGTWVCQAMDLEKVAQAAAVVFCALPHVTSMAVIPTLLAKGCRVLDLSADFRLHDAKVYEEWYGHKHDCPELLAEAVYGLTEFHREQIRQARLVAVPGCYPTSVQLALAPLLQQNWIDLDTIVVDSKSGVTGAGRSASQDLLYCEVVDGIKAYKVDRHRHTPEIEQECSRMAGRAVQVRFTPHLSPHLRGILSTCYVRPHRVEGAQFWHDLYAKFYEAEPFVRVLPVGSYPATAQVRGSNYCDLAVMPDSRTGWLIVLSAIDNLVKGAAGQAVQNFNVMHGFAENEALQGIPLFP